MSSVASLAKVIQAKRPGTSKTKQMELIFSVWEFWTTFQEIPFSRENFLSGRQNSSFHLHSIRNFRIFWVNDEQPLSAHSAGRPQIPGWLVVFREHFSVYKLTRRTQQLIGSSLQDQMLRLRQASYIGETGRNLDTRLTEYKRETGNHTRQRKNLLTSVGIEPTTSGLDLPLLCRLSYKVAQRKSGTI